MSYAEMVQLSYIGHLLYYSVKSQSILMLCQTNAINCNTAWTSCKASSVSYNIVWYLASYILTL